MAVYPSAFLQAQDQHDFERFMKERALSQQKMVARAEYLNWLATPLPGMGHYQQEYHPQPEPTRAGMNYSTAVFLINNKVRAVKGIYEDGGTTGIFKTLDETLKKDDLIVVPTSTRHKMTVFKITEVDIDIDMDANAKVEWVVCKVDQDAYKTILEQEDQAIQKIKSAEMRKKRTDLADALFKDQMEDLKALPIASMGADIPTVTVT